MVFYILILLVITLLILFIFLYHRKYSESFSNYSQIPNLNPILGKKPNVYNLIISKNRKDFYSSNLEISNSEMNQILNTMIDFSQKKKYQNLKFNELKQYNYDYYSGFSGSIVDQQTLKNILISIINGVNQTIFLKEKKESSYLFLLFLILNYQIIKIEVYQKIYKFSTLIDIYRVDKYTGFQINLNFIIDKNDIIIIDMNVSGNFSEDNIKLLKNKEYQNVEIYKKFPYYQPNLNNQNGYLLDSNESKKIIIPVDEQIKYLERKNKKMSNIIYDRSFKCISGKGENLYECTSTLDLNGKKKKKGIWDRPCIFNSECPFYKANKNTDNDFGGCNNGSCQMPLGIKPIGYHFYSDLKDAVCHNCIDSVNCCQEQLDRQKYSKLKSPDYAFENDGRLFV